MDRNSAIGLTLIALLLLLYFNFFAPEPPKQPVRDPNVVTTTDSTGVDKPFQPAANPGTQARLDSLPAQEEKTTVVETDDLILTFSSHGGVLKQVELKKFKTYYKNPLLLVSPNSNSFSLSANLDGKPTDLYKIHYTTESARKSGDSTVIGFYAELGPGMTVRHQYTIPASGYLIRYQIQTSGLASALKGDVEFGWNDFIPVQEKDIRDSRQKTTVNYYLADGTFDGISEGAIDPETETLTSPISWVSIKQKFFTSALVARKPFTGGEIRTSANQADTTVVKSASIRLTLASGVVTNNQADFNYFFGPNDYKVLTATPINGFSKNLNLGWPPVIWVNKFVIIPIFHFLEEYISNYGVIIMILVIIIKLILTPLSYSSYLGMAKMRLLKPELDLIKEKNGDNMTQTQQDQMKLYQQAGVNPFSGCIPLLLQMPILFAMFYFFPVSVELRQQKFLWAEDLSTYDSIVNLPFTIPFYGDHVSLFVLLMTASTLVYTWQNNQITSATGPMKSMSYIMPVVFMFVLNTFSAGLSFYYFVSNLVTFAQQAIIKRFVNEEKIKEVMEDHKKKMLAGAGKKSSFMNKLEQAMKASEEARKNKGR